MSYALDLFQFYVEHGAAGIYNIVHDEPAPVREWLPALAALLGAKPPLRVPKWLARLIGGEHIMTMMTETRAGSNAKAKRDLSWRPAHRGAKGSQRSSRSPHEADMSARARVVRPWA